MGTEITEMTEADYDDVSAFWVAQPGVGLNESDGRHQIANYLHRNDGLSLVVRDNGRVIAAVLCGHDGRRGYLHHLAVATSHRGRGIGKSLVQRCLRSLGQLGISKCNVFVYEDNSDRQGFWLAAGFTLRSDLKLLQRSTAL